MCIDKAAAQMHVVILYYVDVYKSVLSYVLAHVRAGNVSTSVEL